MKIYKSEIKRNPWADHVRVSRTKNGRWIIDFGNSSSELPANTFSCWEHAEWTGNEWANKEYLERIAQK